jgi:ribosome-associated protein
MIDVTPHIRLQDDELEFSYILASGPGGQNVNKVMTAAQLRFDARRSPAMAPEVKARLERLAGSRLTHDGVIVITARRFRSQERNRADAIARLCALIARAAAIPRPRKLTRRPRAANETRLANKSRRARVKDLRSQPNENT